MGFMLNYERKISDNFLKSISVESCRSANLAIFVLEKETGQEEVVGVVERSCRVESFREKIKLRQVDGEQPGAPPQYGRHHHQPLRAAVKLQLLQPEIGKVCIYKMCGPPCY